MVLMNKVVSYLSILVLLLVVLSISSSCGVYSFTGATTNAKTVTIDYFPSKAPNAPVKAAQLFTDALKNKFTTEGNLKSVNSGGELKFTGYISNYTVASRAPVAGEQSGIVQITMTVRVDFENTLDEKDKWSQEFTRYAQYESSQTLTAIEESKIREINTQLVDDIFNKALVKW